MSEGKRKCGPCKGRGWCDILYYMKPSESWPCKECKGTGWLPPPEDKEEEMKEENSKEKRSVDIKLLRDLRTVLLELVDGGECDYDHGGACQVHNFFGEGECSDPRASRLANVLDDIIAVPAERDVDDICNLEGQEFLDALTEAQNKGHYKGWSFSEISRGGSLLPISIYDEKSDDQEITGHIKISSYGSGPDGVNCIGVTETRKGQPVKRQDFYRLSSPDNSAAPNTDRRVKWIADSLLKYVSVLKMGMYEEDGVVTNISEKDRKMIAKTFLDKAKSDAEKLFVEKAMK